jgi:hypothetical protein
MMTNIEKLKIVNELLPFLNSNKDSGLFPRKASMFAKLKPWQKGATLQSAKEITIAELMALSDSDLLDLEKKVVAAKAAKEVKKRQQGYNSRF